MIQYILGFISGSAAILAYGAFLNKKNKAEQLIKANLLNVVIGDIPSGFDGYCYQREDNIFLIRLFEERMEEEINEDNLDLPEVVTTKRLIPIAHGISKRNFVKEISFEEWAIQVMMSCVDGVLSSVPVENYIIEGPEENYHLLRIIEPDGDAIKTIAHGVKDSNGLRLVDEYQWAMQGGIQLINQEGNPILYSINDDEDLEEV